MNSPRSPRKPAKLFASPYHRHAFGSVELADVAWPKPPSDEARNRAPASRARGRHSDAKDGGGYVVQLAGETSASCWWG